jgi:hypothetical protein
MLVMMKLLQNSAYGFNLGDTKLILTTGKLPTGNNTEAVFPLFAHQIIGSKEKMGQAEMYRGN